MKIIGLILAIALAISGCATFNHSESMTVDHLGATGSYTDTRTGSLYKMALLAGGGGGHVGIGAGGLGIILDSSQSQSDPRNFAKSIVMVDLSKKLKSIKVDEIEGIREYEYVQPLTKTEYKPKTQSSLPSAFGHQPIE